LSAKDLALKILNDRAENYLVITREGTDFATSIMIGDAGAMEPLNPVSPEGLMMWARAKELLGADPGVLISINGDRFRQVAEGRFVLDGHPSRAGIRTEVDLNPEPVVNLAAPAKAHGGSSVKSYDADPVAFGDGRVDPKELASLRSRAALHDALMQGRPAVGHTYQETVKEGRLLGREQAGDPWRPVPPQRAAELKRHTVEVKDLAKVAFDTVSEVIVALAKGDSETATKLAERAQQELYRVLVH
jgi:hypothetical protein